MGNYYDTPGPYSLKNGGLEIADQQKGNFIRKYYWFIRCWRPDGSLPCRDHGADLFNFSHNIAFSHGNDPAILFISKGTDRYIGVDRNCPGASGIAIVRLFQRR